MRQSILTRLVVGGALVAAVAAVNCGGDDTSGGGTGTGGSTGTGGAGTGTGGTTGTGGSTGTGGVGTGGTVGTGGAGGAGTGGTVGTGGVRIDAGPDGTAGAGGTTDAGRDASPDVTDAMAAPTFAQVKQLLQNNCVSCHGGPAPQGNPNLINFTDTTNEAGQTLYARLTSPLPTAQEGQCYFAPIVDGGEAGAEAGSDAATDAEASVRANRTPVIGNSLPNSYLYQKVAGGFDGQNLPNIMGNAQASGCGVRMPRVVPASYDASVPDAGLPASVSCDSTTLDGGAAVNCLSASDVGIISGWISAGAPNN
jgi:hypothetical protein